MRYAIAILAVVLFTGCTQDQKDAVDKALATIVTEVQKPKTAELGGQLAVKLWLTRNPGADQVAEARVIVKQLQTCLGAYAKDGFNSKATNKALADELAKVLPSGLSGLGNLLVSEVLAQAQVLLNSQPDMATQADLAASQAVALLKGAASALPAN